MGTLQTACVWLQSPVRSGPDIMMSTPMAINVLYGSRQLTCATSCLQFRADLQALTNLKHLSLSRIHCPFILPADLSGLASLPASIQSVDLTHLGHVFMSQPIAGLAFQPNLERVKFRHCQPLVGNMGDDLRTYAALCFLYFLKPPLSLDPFVPAPQRLPQTTPPFPQ